MTYFPRRYSVLGATLAASALATISASTAQEVPTDFTGIAADADLMQIDVILRAGQRAVLEPADVASAWREARSADRPMLMQVRRGEATLFVALEG